MHLADCFVDTVVSCASPTSLAIYMHALRRHEMHSVLQCPAINLKHCIYVGDVVTSYCYLCCCCCSLCRCGYHRQCRLTLLHASQALGSHAVSTKKLISGVNCRCAAFMVQPALPFFGQTSAVLQPQLLALGVCIVQIPYAQPMKMRGDPSDLKAHSGNRRPTCFVLCCLYAGRAATAA